jgi:hypothetical protein
MPYGLYSHAVSAALININELAVVSANGYNNANGYNTL